MREFTSLIKMSALCLLFCNISSFFRRQWLRWRRLCQFSDFTLIRLRQWSRIKWRIQIRPNRYRIGNCAQGNHGQNKAKVPHYGHVFVSWQVLHWFAYLFDDDDYFGVVLVSEFWRRIPTFEERSMNIRINLKTAWDKNNMK